jgi:hypothetical protein
MKVPLAAWESRLPNIRQDIGEITASTAAVRPTPREYSSRPTRNTSST